MCDRKIIGMKLEKKMSTYWENEWSFSLRDGMDQK